jgi:hypothetical protein
MGEFGRVCRVEHRHLGATQRDVFSVLRRSGTISHGDFKGTGELTIADGSTVQSDRYVLHKVTVGDHVITDVIANVFPAKTDALLGQSFLEKLPAWKLDNSRHALVLEDEGHTTGAQPETAAVPSPPAPPQRVTPAPANPSTAAVCLANLTMLPSSPPTHLPPARLRSIQLAIGFITRASPTRRRSPLLIRSRLRVTL